MMEGFERVFWEKQGAEDIIIKTAMKLALAFHKPKSLNLPKEGNSKRYFKFKTRME